MSVFLRVSALSLLGILGSVRITAGEPVGPTPPPPETVSPGSLHLVSEVGGACPGFSWGEVAGAETYELVVYGISDQSPPHPEEEPALRRILPGGALSWIPDRTDCLDPGRSYAWSIRAVAEFAPGPWSQPRLFSVPAGPSSEDVAEAVELLRRHFAWREGEDPTVRQADHRAAATAVGSSRDGLSSSPEKLTLDAATTAIRGELPPTTGNTIGVAGITNSPDGAGIAAANANPAGGPDLLLDGAAQGVPDTILTESGLIRDSASGAGFDISNPSGPMGLTLAGVPVVTTLTDQDTLGGLSCPSGRIAKFDGAAWICALDADTVGGLSCATDEFPRFDGADWICTAYSAETLTAANPGQPHSLRLGPEPSGSGKRRLSWAMDDLAGVASFVVYQSDQAITDTNKSTAAATVTGDLHAPVRLFPASGSQHFRVEARNLLGEAGPLSPELVIDTTPRLAYRADQEFDNIFELFVTPATGGGATTRVNDPLLTVSDVIHFAWSPDGTRLGYVADQDTDDVLELFVASAAGGGAVKVNGPLVEGGTVDFDSRFAWSPDGTHLAYIADQDTDGVFELFVGLADGSGSIRVNDPLVAGGRVVAFAWSPGGDSLAYAADQEADGVVELFVAPVGGGGSVRVSDDPVGGGGVFDFAWSPGGSRLAYIADQESDDDLELFVAPATGGDSIKLNDTLATNGDVIILSWSPDGTRLAYLADQDTDEVFELFVTPATGGGVIKINDPLLNGSSLLFGGFAWSPDGTRLAYGAFQETHGVLELFVAPATGGGSTKVNDTLVSGGDLGGFAWSPDGTRLAYRADQDTDNVLELFVVPADGRGGSIKINDALTGGGDIGQDGFAWSPDGARLAYRADQDTDEVLELFVAPATGGGAVKVNGTLTAGGDVTDFAWSPLGSGEP